MDVRLALAVVLLFIVNVSAQGDVQFWRTTVTLTCPNEGTWFINGVKEENATNQQEFKYSYDGKMNPLSYCEYSEYPENTDVKTKYLFYVKGKVCEDCFELDANMFLVVIIVDVIGTMMVMMAIYKCAKKKASTGPTRPKAPSRSGPAPPTPSRDYEQLNVHTRSQDTYSIVNRTG